ncbi:probable WRKY transcription factor 33 isoform X2 [Phalaenopsis equestris]|uniref:probable WRKY transcription factor 33 isoform X2 n=1 Tax=Phalaenopsis equestris TaxID=78828 RepID=UPI0009E65329|nr:probable WRKY transcription factor 33 isoform X2 [Phalaenopsis equestris]
MMSTLHIDGTDEKLAIFGDWEAFNPSPKTFKSEHFSKDFVLSPVPDVGENDSQTSSITMEFEKKIQPMGLDWTSDISSEIFGFNVQNSCWSGTEDEKMATMDPFNMFEVNMSPSEKEKIPFEVNSSLPGECSSWMLFSTTVDPTSVEESLNFFPNNSMVVSTIDEEQTSPQRNLSLQGNLKLLESTEKQESTQDTVADKKASLFLAVNEIPPPPPPPPPPDYLQNEETGHEAEFSFPERDPTKDGYKWRKYGQKQLKGCEFPCSYHKCCYPNCPAKKKVERSYQGNITEIIYKGSHNHPKPPPNNRSVILSSKKSHGPRSGSSNRRDLAANLKGNLSTGSEQSDGLGGNSSASVAALEVLKAVDTSCPLSDDKEENGAIHGSCSDDRDIEQDEMESKKRKQELCSNGKRATTSRALRDSRISVQILSELNIPDDGYRWRKYGQKVVKGNSNPRCYYKCAHSGCSVRKQVERASEDLKSVISTYEGRHNHGVPSARYIHRARYCLPSPTPTAQFQLTSPYPQPELAQFSPNSLESLSPISTFGLLGCGQTSSFPFCYDPSNLVGLRSLGWGSMKPFFSPLQQISCGMITPKREPKEEPM